MLAMMLVLGGCATRQPATIPLPARTVTPSADSGAAMVGAWMAAMEGTLTTQIVVSEADLTALARANMVGAPLDDLTIWIEEGHAVLDAHCTTRACHQVRAIVQLTTRDGQPRLLIDQTTIDGRRVPPFILASLQSALNDALTDSALPLRIDAVRLYSGRAEFTVSPRP